MPADPRETHLRDATLVAVVRLDSLVRSRAGRMSPRALALAGLLAAGCLAGLAQHAGVELRAFAGAQPGLLQSLVSSRDG